MKKNPWSTGECPSQSCMATGFGPFWTPNPSEDHYPSWACKDCFEESKVCIHTYFLSHSYTNNVRGGLQVLGLLHYSCKNWVERLIKGCGYHCFGECNLGISPVYNHCQVHWKVWVTVLIILLASLACVALKMHLVNHYMPDWWHISYSGV